jgi:hypothetical protein
MADSWVDILLLMESVFKTAEGLTCQVIGEEKIEVETEVLERQVEKSEELLATIRLLTEKIEDDKIR